MTSTRLYQINSGVFVHAPHHMILSSIMTHIAEYSADAEGGFLQTFINENRDRRERR